jgi:EmrB/QacA subfamily drug resistance transporter
LCTVALGLTMILLDTSIVSVANATIGRNLHSSLTGLQWVTSAFLLAIASGLVTGGKLGDLFGRRRLFTLGAAGFALASAGCGLSVSVAMLTGFRIAQGLAGAAMMPQTLATLRATFGAARFQLAVGAYVGISSLAIASGPIVGGALVQETGWRSIFFINVVIGPVTVAAARFFMPETRDPRAAGIDLPGALLLTSALFCLVWALVNSGGHAWGSVYTLGFLAAAAVLLAAWALWTARAQTPLVPLALFRTPGFDAGIGVVATAGFAMYGTLFYLTLYLQRVDGASPAGAGASLLPLTVLSGLAGPAGGMLARKIPLRLLLSGGLILLCGGALGLTSLAAGSGEAGLWPWLALMGTGIGLTLTGGSQAVVGSAPAARAGIATGIQQTSLNIGGALATAVLGSVAGSHGIHVAFVVVAAVAGAAALAAICFIRTPGRHGQSPAAPRDIGLAAHLDHDEPASTAGQHRHSGWNIKQLDHFLFRLRLGRPLEHGQNQPQNPPQVSLRSRGIHPHRGTRATGRSLGPRGDLRQRGSRHHGPVIRRVTRARGRRCRPGRGRHRRHEEPVLERQPADQRRHPDVRRPHSPGPGRQRHYRPRRDEAHHARRPRRDRGDSARVRGHPARVQPGRGRDHPRPERDHLRRLEPGHTGRQRERCREDDQHRPDRQHDRVPVQPGRDVQAPGGARGLLRHQRRPAVHRGGRDRRQRRHERTRREP